jgi:hypothetical protein
MRFSNVSLVCALFLFFGIVGALALVFAGVVTPDSLVLADDTGWDLDDTGWDISGV